MGLAAESEIGVAAVERTERGVGRDRVVARHTIAGAQFEVGDPVRVVLDETLLRNAPCHGGRGEEGPLAARRELRGAVLAERSRHDVAVVEGVLQAADDRNHLVADES